MSSKRLRLGRRGLVASIAAAALAAVGGTALAGHVTGTVKSYTGCLTTVSGQIKDVKEGDAPLKACGNGETQVHFSGGDITAISAATGSGLTGGGMTGAVSLSIRRDCANAQVLKWSGTGWECGADGNSTYTAGTGLDLNGSEFSVEPDNLVSNNQACTSGQFAKGITSGGSLDCAVPSGGGPGVQAFTASRGIVEVAGTTTIISKTLPAGSYVLTAHVDTYSPSFADDASGRCDISGDRATFFFTDGEAANGNATLTSAISHAGGAVLLTCTESSGNFDVTNASLTAIKVDSIG